ncbi:5-carboxymethyl-2-hydroxymuconate Delta-isomerase [Vibrio algarum]|uniref:5-carboxymethyl-2-hydroxymuconate Delta-isomerase n=1 Tax=Vibrio algarum TaxID=3020714 RepID=A0ABT4YNW1_9VIBR|nr:5-carboxymethyl-2-hydroxymuconate Delta-isomerase [Vibrio sp. KJ40-1]MDB1122759.1 5-carboxymethyl-2-hydroxymuconate Delta-isomerase [Vibrio sp. KJ40-1]
MPNIVLEYTNSVEDRVNIQGLLKDLHQVALDCGLFQADDVKSRALRCHQWLIGEYDDSEDFIHITFEMLSGRSDEQKNKLSHQLIDVLTAQAGTVKSVSVNMRDMDRSTFKKVLN